MRFYYLTIAIFLQAINLFAQASDAYKLNEEQIAIIQTQGTKGIQAVFIDSGIQIQDLPAVEKFVSEAALSKLNGIVTSQIISDTANEFIIAITELSLSENIKASYVIEYVSAGVTYAAAITSLDKNLDSFEAIQAASKGSASGAIQFAKSYSSSLDTAISAASSGSLAGAIEITKNLDLDVFKAVQSSASGLISSTISETVENDIEIYETLTSATIGLAEAAVEASVKENLNLIPQLKASAIGAGVEATDSSTLFDLDKNQTLYAIQKGLSQGAIRAIPGQGSNIRIFIAPIKDIDLLSIVEEIEAGNSQGASQAGYTVPDFIPIIETPLDDDRSVHKVSPSE